MDFADTGRPHRESEGGESWNDELGRQEAGGLRSWPTGCFAKSEKRWKEEMKTTRAFPPAVAVTTASKN